MGDVLGFMASSVSNRYQMHAQAFVDQKPHATPIVASFRRER
jgi:hypothetical protein